MADNWNETIQHLFGGEGAKIEDPAARVGHATFTEAPAPPISEMPEEWKDGRKVLVFGEFVLSLGAHRMTDIEKAWYAATYLIDNKGEHMWCPIGLDARCDTFIDATHYLPYPADPV